MKMIAIASGKGGVGKSTVAINLALALTAQGQRVGLLDADIYGPSQPFLLGATQQKPLIEQNQWQPVQKYGLQTMSIGYLVEVDVAMMWRGPMLGKAIEQMMHQTDWQQLDFLIIDLPPGTGDIQLTLCQKMQLSGALMVTTPQELALLDARRAAKMFQHLNVPLIGVIENMSYHSCSHCGHSEPIFGVGAGERLSKELSVPFLGGIPLASAIQEMSDSGIPPLIQAPDNEYAKIFHQFARHVLGSSLLKNNLLKKFPKVVVEHHPNQKGK